MEEFELKLAENTALLRRLIETAKAKLKSRPRPPPSRPPPLSYSDRPKFAQENRMQLKIPRPPANELREPPNLVPEKIREKTEILAEMIHRSARIAENYAFEVEDYASYTKKIAAKRVALLGQIKARVHKNKIADAVNTFYGTRPTPTPPDEKD